MIAHCVNSSQLMRARTVVIACRDLGSSAVHRADVHTHRLDETNRQPDAKERGEGTGDPILSHGSNIVVVNGGVRPLASR